MWMRKLESLRIPTVPVSLSRNSTPISGQWQMPEGKGFSHANALNTQGYGIRASAQTINLSGKQPNTAKHHLDASQLIPKHLFRT